MDQLSAVTRTMNNTYKYSISQDYETSTFSTNLSKSEQLNYVVNVYVDGILCLFGFVGNSLAIFFLQKDRNRNSNTYLLQVLALYDIFFLIHTMLYTVLRSIYPATGHLKEYYQLSPYIITFDLPCGWIAQTGTIWVSTTLVLDRYLAISRPFKAIILCTLRNAQRLAAILTVAAILFNVPRFFHYYLVAIHSDNNTTFIAHVRVDLPGWNSELYHYIYHIGLTFIFLYIIPLTTLTFFNVKLIMALRSADVLRSGLSRSRNINNKYNWIVTFNLVIVISKFILCETPDFISSILGTIQEITAMEPYKMFNTIKEMLLVLNSTANFYIYVAVNRKFRLNMYQSCCWGGKNQIHLNSSIMLSTVETCQQQHTQTHTLKM